MYLAAINSTGNTFDLSSIGRGLESVSTSFASYGASGSGSSGGFSGGGGGGGGGGRWWGNELKYLIFKYVTISHIVLRPST